MQQISRNSKKLLVASMMASAAFALPTSQASAQDNDEAASTTNEGVIIVTARKREESLQDVPISITAISGDELREQNAFSFEDIAQSTPGLTFEEAAGVSAPTIRGLAQTDQGAFTSNVGIFLDGVFLNSRSSIEFANLDIARVEVLKGPQSALYGRDTFAGAINYVTREPEFGSFGGYVQGDIGSDERYGLKGSLNIPIGEAVAVRLFGGYSSFDGTIENERGGDNLGGYDKRLTFGGSIYAEPTDGMRIKVFFARNEVEEDQPPLRRTPFTANTAGTEITNANGTFFTLFEGDVPTFETVDLDPRGVGNDGYLNLGYFNIEMDLPFATFTGNYSYSESSYSTFIDNGGDATAINRPLSPFLATPYSAQFFTNQSGDASRQHAVEMKFTSREDSDIFWTVGGSFYDLATGGITSSFATLLADPSTTEIITRVPRRLEQEAFAIYGALTVPIGDRLNIGGEIRYTDESQLQTGITEIFFIPGFPVITTSDGVDFDYWTGRVSVDYEVAPDVLVYGYAARGLKTGGINVGRPEDDPFFQFDPETNWTYELGVKSQLWDGRATVNAAVFYIDWQNVQIRAPGSLTTVNAVINGSSATSKGIEVDTAIQVTDNFTVTAAASYTDPTYDSGFQDGRLNAACPALVATPTACTTDVGGNQITRTSKFQFYGSATYEIPDVVGDFGAFVRADYSHRGKQFPLGANLARTGAIDLVNARIGLRSDTYTIAAWVDNLFDKEYNARVLMLGSPTAPIPGAVQANVFRGNGRTFGLTASANF